MGYVYNDIKKKEWNRKGTSHRLYGEYAECWECHLESDWLMIWRQNDMTLELILVDTGSHSDLF